MISTTYKTPRTLLISMVCMLVIPIFSYFAAKQVLRNTFHFADNSTYVWSAVIAVLAVHAVLICVIWAAYKEEQIKQIVEEKVD